MSSGKEKYKNEDDIKKRNIYEILNKEADIPILLEPKVEHNNKVPLEFVSDDDLKEEIRIFSGNSIGSHHFALVSSDRLLKELTSEIIFSEEQRTMIQEPEYLAEKRIIEPLKQESVDKLKKFWGDQSYILTETQRKENIWSYPSNDGVNLLYEKFTDDERMYMEKIRFQTQYTKDLVTNMKKMRALVKERLKRQRDICPHLVVNKKIHPHYNQFVTFFECAICGVGLLKGQLVELRSKGRFQIIEFEKK